jgi:uncharacterized protein (TIGR03437 family)
MNMPPLKYGLARGAVGAVFLAVALPGLMNAQLIGQVILNKYSYILPEMPNYGIAQGSIFMMVGTNDMTQTTASQGVPLQTTLAGVTVTVTVAGVTTQAIPYYVSPSQIDAILPSKTPVGQGTVTVTSGGNSISAPITVVQSAFGLDTVPPAGGGGVVTAVAQDYNEGGQLLSQSNAANPGEYLTFWGSGLGPVSGDETQYQTPMNLANIPIEVDIGGVSAIVTYHGRSIYPGLDQINVIVPAGVSGCNVSVVVIAGGVPSNTATIPVAASGRICSDPGLVPLSASEYQGLLSLGSVNVGAISLTSLATTNTGNNAATTDSASAAFQRYTAQQFASASFLQVPSMGSCLVTAWPPEIPLLESSTFTQLNAGPQIDLGGPDGLLALPRSGMSGIYSEPAGTSPPIVPSAGGTFTFDNATGGPDVGAFTASMSEALSPPLVWTNRSAITAINRAQGQLITWSGGAPGSYVSVFGYSSVYEPTPLANGPRLFNTYFVCSAPLSAGQFMVPAAVLNGLPATGVAQVAGLPPTPNGYLYVVSGNVQQFSAPGLDLALLFFSAGSGISVPFN